MCSGGVYLLITVLPYLWTCSYVAAALVLAVNNLLTQAGLPLRPKPNETVGSPGVCRLAPTVCEFGQGSK